MKYTWKFSTKINPLDHANTRSVSALKDCPTSFLISATDETKNSLKLLANGFWSTLDISFIKKDWITKVKGLFRILTCERGPTDAGFH